jgi:hypothetical protein
MAKVLRPRKILQVGMVIPTGHMERIPSDNEELPTAHGE